MESPRTQYARNGDVYLAYQVVGKGPVDLLLIQGRATHVENQWDFPSMIRWLEQLVTFARIVTFDGRGVGLSDPVRDWAEVTPGDQVRDALAVLDAAGVSRTAVSADNLAGSTGVRLVVEQPERVSHLILDGACARLLRAPDYRDGMSTEAADRFITRLRDSWGTGVSAELFAPTVELDERQLEEWARAERSWASPSQVEGLTRWWMAQDVRDLLPLITVPTLVVHDSRDPFVPVELGRYAAAHIPGARFIEKDLRHGWGADVDALAGDVAEFLTGSRAAARVDRMLTTVLFTDIVTSTERAVALGDRAWRDLLGEFRRRVRRELRRHGGTEVDTRGDDFFATFDSPTAAIACAVAVREMTTQMDLAVRTGLHLGEVERHDGDIAGLAVHIGARISAVAAPDEILVSQTVRDAVAGSQLSFADRGAHVLKGVPGTWRTYALEEA